MITDRVGSRENVFRWMTEIARVARSEKAKFTVERVQDLAEPIFAMLASSDAADPQEMRALIGRENFPARAERYLARNTFLNLGIPAPKDAQAQKTFDAQSGAVAKGP